MKLHIENIAKIEKADIEINGITVIAGENSTGKSTVSKVLYCLFETFKDIEAKISNEKRQSIDIRLSRQLKNNEKDEDGLEIFFVPVDFKQEIVDGIIKGLDSGELRTEEEIEELVNGFLNGTPYTMSDINSFSKYVLTINKMTVGQVNGTLMSRCLSTEFNHQYLPLYNVYNTPRISLNIKDEDIDLLYDFEIDSFINTKFTPITHSIIYLDDPHLIDSLTMTPQEVSLAMRRRKRKFRLVANHNARMENMITDPLGIDRNKSVFDEIIIKDSYNKIIQKLIELLDGEIDLIENEFRFIEDGIDEPIDLINLSMGSKSLVTILKLIKSGNIVENGIIILDEPEIHLHLKWQLSFAEILILMQKELNLHILINTHSAYFINALEVYSSIYKIANRCKYYFATLNDSKRAEFEDVTTNIGKIYIKLAQPLLDLEDLVGQ